MRSDHHPDKGRDAADGALQMEQLNQGHAEGPTVGVRLWGRSCVRSARFGMLTVAAGDLHARGPTKTTLPTAVPRYLLHNCAVLYTTVLFRCCQIP